MRSKKIHSYDLLPARVRGLMFASQRIHQQVSQGNTLIHGRNAREATTISMLSDEINTDYQLLKSHYDNNQIEKSSYRQHLYLLAALVNSKVAYDTNRLNGQDILNEWDLLNNTK